MFRFFSGSLIRARRFFPARVFLWALLSAMFCAHNASAAGELPVPAARIIYTADTLGYLHPCASCGDNTQGGLARRAALLRELTAGQKHPLVIAGPNEFADGSHGELPPGETKTRALHAAFSKMPYSAIYITRQTAERFTACGLNALPHSVVVPEEKPVTEYYRAGAFAVACVFFPPGDGARGGSLSAGLVSAVAEAAREAARNASLVIGISPWGMDAENALMHGELRGLFQVILGGGRGIAVPGQAVNPHEGPGPLWVRSDRRGRAVNVVDIFALPAKRAFRDNAAGDIGGGAGDILGRAAGGAAWIDGIHFSSRLVFLEKDLPEDEEVAKIAKTVPQD